MIYSKKDIMKGLQDLGLKKGDICVVRSALREIGDISGKRSAVVLDALLDTVGEDGTIVTLTFTETYRLPLDPHNPKHVFTKNTPPRTGGLPRECLSRPDTIRSKHPSNSFCAIGKDAQFILSGHNERKPSYEPIGRAIEKKGKMLLIGAIYTVPGFTSVHWAQWLLGLATKSKQKNKYGVYYLDENLRKRLFVREDIGGCSKGFSRFYNHYRKAGILSEGKVGDAPSMLIELEKALAVEEPLIKQNPRFPLCSDPGCRECRTGWEFSEFSDMSPLEFFLRNPRTLLSLMFSKLKG